MKLALFKIAFKAAIIVFAFICWLDDRFRFRFRFPRDLDDLLARRDWCLKTLQEAGALPEGIEVTHFAADPFKGDEAFRSTLAQVRVEYMADGAPGLVRFVAKFAPQAGSLTDRAVYILQENHVKEIGFYQHLAADIGSAAPRAYYAEMSRATGHFCLLLEWVGDGVEYSERDGCPVERAQVAFSALAKLHATHWGLARPGSEYLQPITDVVIDFFSSLFEGPDREIFGHVLGVCWRHNCLAPQTVIHGDPRVGNMIFATPEGAGRFVLLDWQCVRKGKSAFDIAYLMAISLDPQTRVNDGEALLRYYHDALCAAGVEGYDFETLVDDFKYASILVLALLDLPFLVAEAIASST
jgi:hypothetical protein